MRDFVAGFLFAVCGAVAFAEPPFGVNFDAALTNSPTSSRIYPVAKGRYELVQPDGNVRVLTESPDRPHVLLGESPWLGFVQGDKIAVWADPDLTGGRRRTAFSFDSGRLSEIFIDGFTYRFPLGYKPPVETVSDLWPEERPLTFEKSSDGDIWRYDRRVRFWFVNPNSAGLLMAELALFCLLLLGFRPLWVKAIGVVLFLAATYGLFLTESRSAFLALGLGLVIYALPRLRSLRKFLNARTFAAMAFCALAAVAFLWLTDTWTRFTVDLVSLDAGNSRRIDVALAQLRMLADSALGWPGNTLRFRAFCLNWYLPQYDHTIWTHFSSLAQRGWIGATLYLASWFCAFALSIRFLVRGHSAFPCAVLSAYFMAGWFNPVYQDKSLAAIPVIALVSAVALDRPSFRSLCKAVALSVVGAALMVSGFVVWGSLIRPSYWPKISLCGKCVCLNGNSPKVWIVEDKLVMGGCGFPGREAVLHYIKHPKAQSIGYASRVEDLPREVETLVLAGEAGQRFLDGFASGAATKARRILFLSPSFDPHAIPISLRESTDILVLRGNLVAPAKAVGEANVPWIRELPGVQLYVANWMSLLTQLQALPK